MITHDALYQLLREGLIGQRHKEAADRLLQRICIEDGMSHFRAWYVYQGVRIFGGGSSRPTKKRTHPLLTAPSAKL